MATVPRLQQLKTVREQGFTLVELILVIVLLGILAVASTQFIHHSTGIYQQSVSRDKLQQQGRFAIERINRELRNALPGSVRLASNTSTQCLEFIPVLAASSYLQPVADTARSSLAVVDFGYTFNSGDLLAVYPIDSDSVYQNPSPVLAVLTGVTAGGVGQQILAFTAKKFSNESPTGRFFIVKSPVSFCVENNSLSRHQDYGRALNQTVPPANSKPLAKNIRLDDGGTAVTAFSFTAGTLQRSAAVHLDLRFSGEGATGEEWLRFSQEVLVRNTP